MVSVNPEVLKKCFNLYEDQSLYNNYSKIANKYYKLYKENNSKKNSSDFQEKLREEVKKWLFNQSLENRMKICTVENELYGKILYRMIDLKKSDKTMLFKPKPYFFPDLEENSEQFTSNLNNMNDYNYNHKTEDGIFYPPKNTDIKITKTNKNGKKTEAPKLGYSQSSLEGFNNEEILTNNLGNFFTFQSFRGNYSLPGSNEYSNLYNSENQKMIELCSEEFINNIIFFSVHHRYFPDCFTLSPEFLLEKEKFENSFYTLGNKKYFCSLIQADVITGNNKSQKLYTYKMPDWLVIKNNSEEYECLHSVTQYAIAFFEQVIMIKYLLNKNDKKVKTYSLLDEQALNRFFTDRKMAINYMKKNYNSENKLNILNDLEIEKYYNNVMTNKEKIKYVDYYNKICHNEKYKNNPYIDTILNNPHSNKSEEKYNKIKNIPKQKSNKNELNLEQIKSKITDIIKNNDIIYFIDYLLFQNYHCIWKNEYFLQSELFEKLSNLITEQNLKELIFDSKPSKSNKSKHRKKNKKNHNMIINNNSIQQNKIEEEKNNNKIQNEYEGIFKDEEEELYAPYYLKANTEQKKMYLKLKGNNVYENNKDKEIIRQFISKEIILGLIIDNVFLTPLNSDLDFFEKFKDDSYKNEEYKIYKDEDKKIEENENEIKDNNIDHFEKNELNINNRNNIIDDEKEENQNIINDNNSNNVDIESNNLNLNLNNKESSNTNISKENDLENNDSLSLKSDNFSSEIDKSTTITINTCEETIQNNNNDNSIKKNGDDTNNNINNSNINNSNNNNSKPKKKKEKEQTFFLFDTVKKKKKKNIHNSNNNALISNEFNIIVIKEANTRLSFRDKLHNDIIKYETKVITLLNHGMKFKDYCIKEIKRIIQETFTFSNDYNVDIYGSYATGLMIEGSDIDIKIKLNNGNKSDLDNFFETLCKKLENEKKFDKINPIGTASVPVIKLLLSIEKFIKGKEDLENSYKQYKDLSLFKHYIFDINELTRIKIDVTFILANNYKNDNSSANTSVNNSINNEINETKEKSTDNNNSEQTHDHDKSIGGEMSSVAYVKEQIVKYPEVKYILRVLKRYFYYKKMNTSFLGGLSSYNLFLILLSYAKYIRMTPNSSEIIIENNSQNNKSNINLGHFLINFLDFFISFNFSQCIIDINSPGIYIDYNLVAPEKSKEYNIGKSIVIIDPLTGVNASKSSYKIEEIQKTFVEASDFFYNEKIKYDKEGKTKISKNNNNKDILMGLPIPNKNDNNHGGGGNIIEKFLGKQ